MIEDISLRLHAPCDTSIFLTTTDQVAECVKEFEKTKQKFERETGHEIQLIDRSTVEASQSYEVNGELGLFSINFNKRFHDFEITTKTKKLTVQVTKASLFIYTSGTAIFRVRYNFKDDDQITSSMLNEVITDINVGDGHHFEKTFGPMCEEALAVLKDIIPERKEVNFFGQESRNNFFYWVHTFIIIENQKLPSNDAVSEFYMRASKGSNEKQYCNMSGTDQFHLFSGAGVSIAVYQPTDENRAYMKMCTSAQELEALIWKCLWNADSFLRKKLKLINSYLYYDKSVKKTRAEERVLKKMSLQIQIFLDEFKSSQLTSSYPILNYMEQIRVNWRTNDIQADVVDKLALISESLDNFNTQERAASQHDIEMVLIFITFASTLSVIWDGLSLFSLDMIRLNYKVLLIVTLWTVLLVSFKWVLPRMRKGE